MPVSNAELASSNAIPLDVTLLMDTSGSTEGEGLAQAKNAAIAFIQGLAPEDRVAVMRFANSVTLQQDFTTDKQAAINAINALSSRGQTELYKATDAAVRQAATSPSATARDDPAYGRRQRCDRNGDQRIGRAGHSEFIGRAGVHDRAGRGDRGSDLPH